MTAVEGRPAAVAAATAGDAVHECFAPCPRGLEAALADEVRACGGLDGRAAGGGVAFHATLATIYRINLRSRLASRVLMLVGLGRYRTDKDLHALALSLPWERVFVRGATLRVDTSAQRSPLQSLNLATLRVKDGIVDRLREVNGDRPDIDTRMPDVRVQVFLDAREARLYLDTSGENLFKRGWRGREDRGAAPIKENLAAGLLRLAGWNLRDTLFDPFCGSGTILIEAAQMARGLPAGGRRVFGFERLPSFDAALWQAVRDEAAHQASAAEAAPAPDALPLLHGADIDPAACAQVRANAHRAGLEPEAIRCTTGDFLTLEPPSTSPGLMIANLPYGERLEVADLQALMRAAGARLRTAYGGWRVALLSSDLRLPGALGLRESRRIPLFNGPIECRLFLFEMR